MPTQIERTPEQHAQFAADMRRRLDEDMLRPVWPRTPSYECLSFNLLAAALYNARHAGDPLKTWDEIAANEITRNFYTAAASIAMRAVFPTEGY